MLRQSYAIADSCRSLRCEARQLCQAPWPAPRKPPRLARSRRWQPGAQTTKFNLRVAYSAATRDIITFSLDFSVAVALEVRLLNPISRLSLRLSYCWRCFGYGGALLDLWSLVCYSYESVVVCEVDIPLHRHPRLNPRTPVNNIASRRICRPRPCLRELPLSPQSLALVVQRHHLLRPSNPWIPSQRMKMLSRRRIRWALTRTTTKTWIINPEP